jgi:hypothetical protein
MSLYTGKRIYRHRWTNLRTPGNAIARVNHLALREGMPRTITFVNRFGFELADENEDIDDDNDSAYDSDDNNSIDEAFDNGSADDNDSDLTEAMMTKTKMMTTMTQTKAPVQDCLLLLPTPSGLQE